MNIFGSRISLMRALRIIIGVFFIGAAYGEKSWPMAILGVILTIQGILNTGCGMGSGGCDTTQNNNYSSKFDADKSIRKLNL